MKGTPTFVDYDQLNIKKLAILSRFFPRNRSFIDFSPNNHQAQLVKYNFNLRSFNDIL